MKHAGTWHRGKNVWRFRDEYSSSRLKREEVSETGASSNKIAQSELVGKPCFGSIKPWNAQARDQLGRVRHRGHA